MQLHRIVFLSLCLLFSISSTSQKVIVNVYMDNKIASPQSDTIYYDVNRKLTWDDFKGKPDMNHPGAAVTASGFAYSWNGENDGKTLHLNIFVYTYFTKKRSWKKSFVEGEYHLRHEQHHFDITRLGAEKLVEELKRADYTMDNYRSMIAGIFDRVYNENIVLQNKYDHQTKHSLDTEKQEEWNKRINERVISL